MYIDTGFTTLLIEGDNIVITNNVIEGENVTINGIAVDTPLLIPIFI